MQSDDKHVKMVDTFGGTLYNTLEVKNKIEMRCGTYGVSHGDGVAVIDVSNLVMGDQGLSTSQYMTDTMKRLKQSRDITLAIIVGSNSRLLDVVEERIHREVTGLECRKVQSWHYNCKSGGVTTFDDAVDTEDTLILMTMHSLGLRGTGSVVLVTSDGNDDANATYKGVRVLDKDTFGNNFVESVEKLSETGTRVEVWGLSSQMNGGYQRSLDSGHVFGVHMFTKKSRGGQRNSGGGHWRKRQGGGRR
jgi:hypothetical protein